MSPATPDLEAVVKSFTELRASLSFSLPGEGLVTAIIQYAGVFRQTMDKDLLKRLDTVTIQQIEDLQGMWRGLFVSAGLLK